MKWYFFLLGLLFVQVCTINNLVGKFGFDLQCVVRKTLLGNSSVLILILYENCEGGYQLQYNPLLSTLDLCLLIGRDAF